MYVPFASQCTEENSATPMTAARIAAQDARVAAVGNQFWRGNHILDVLDVVLGGNSIGQIPGAVDRYTGGAVGPPPGSGPGESPSGRGAKGSGPFENSRRVGCPAPQVLPLLTVFPIPPAPRPASKLPPPVAPPSPHLAPPAPAPPPPVTQASCRTGNICADLRAGCVLQYQVSPEQLLACAMAGWSGNQNRYPSIAARSDLPFLGSVDLNPPAATGVSGLGADDLATSSLWAGIALLGFAAWATFEISKPARRRR